MLQNAFLFIFRDIEVTHEIEGCVFECVCEKKETQTHIHTEKRNETVYTVS